MQMATRGKKKEGEGTCGRRSVKLGVREGVWKTRSAPQAGLGRSFENSSGKFQLVFFFAVVLSRYSIWSLRAARKLASLCSI